jgi:hypothetical protein
MRFAVAKEIITPPFKTHLSGYEVVHDKYFQGIHDDLFVKTLLLDDGSTKVILLTLDLCFHDFALTQTVGNYLRNKYKVSPDNLILSYTHTHTGPAIKGYDPGQYSEEYEEFLLNRIQNCLDKAFVNIFEGTIEYGRINDDWSVNRRKCIDGKFVNAPNLEGVTDPELVFLKICDEDKNIKVLLLNHSCHVVTLGASSWISADFPGRICHLLEAEYYGSVSLFFQGAGANTRPKIAIDPAGDAWRSCRFDQVDEMSSAIVAGIKKAILRGQSVAIDSLNLGSKRFVIPLEIEPYPKAHFEKIANDAKEVPQMRKSANIVVQQYDSLDNVVRLNASIIRLSDDMYIAFLCGEVCVEVKQHIKKAFGDKEVIFIGYGDSTAYIPDDKIIQEGGYEAEGSVVEYGLKGKFKLGVDKKMQDTYCNNLQLVS